MHDKILTTDIADDDARLAHAWISADGQKLLDMVGSTLAEAKAEMLGQCGTDEQRANILAGSIEIDA